MREAATPPPLLAVRRLIDHVDRSLLLLVAARRALVARAAAIKRQAGVPLRDDAREARVQAQARRWARRLGIAEPTAQALAALLIDDACRLQGIDPTLRSSSMSLIALAPPHASAAPRIAAPSWLRWLPPPARLAPLLRRVPDPLLCRLLDELFRRALAAPLAAGLLQPLERRRVGIAVSDLGLGWTVVPQAGRIAVEAGLAQAESIVHGSATDLLLLASRLEDADTLFFQRRLKLTGDIELGLTARNLLDQMPWEQVPLAARIVLHRVARFAGTARQAWRAARHPEPAGAGSG